MKQLFQETLVVLDFGFSKLESQVPPPQEVSWGNGYVYRYEEETIYQAIILKMARMISGLRAALLLLENGYVQEQAAMQRILDELGEDIQFLVYALTIDELTDLHKRYLSAFFQEEFDAAIGPVESPQKRPMIPRKKIQSYMIRAEDKAARKQGNMQFKVDRTKVARTISKTYSGYIHAAAPHIMDMYGGYPPAFHLAGMLGTPRIREHTDDLWNYFYRGLMSLFVAARSFGDSELENFVLVNLKNFEEVSGNRAK